MGLCPYSNNYKRGDSMGNSVVIIGFFAAMLTVFTFIRFYTKRKERKENLLNAITSKNRSAQCEVIFNNQFIGIAVSTAMQTVFSNINDYRVRTRVFDILKNYTDNLSVATYKITIPTLSRMLLMRASEEGDPDVSEALESLSKELVAQMSTMVCDVNQYSVSTKDVSQIFTFSLKSVELIDVRVYA